MKKIAFILLLLVAVSMTACAGRGLGSGKQDNYQGLKKSPCASLTWEKNYERV